MVVLVNLVTLFGIGSTDNLLIVIFIFILITCLFDIQQRNFVLATHGSSRKNDIHTYGVIVFSVNLQLTGFLRDELFDLNSLSTSRL